MREYLCPRCYAEERYVIAIGIEHYENVAQFSQVRFAEADAQEFQDYAQKRWKVKTHVTPLIGRTATKAAIQNAVYTILTKAGAGDAVFLFISARGMTDPLTNTGYIYPYVSLVENGISTGIPLDYFSSVVRNRLQQPAGPVYIFADVCRPEPADRKNWIESSLKRMAIGNPSIQGYPRDRARQSFGRPNIHQSLEKRTRIPRGEYEKFFEEVKKFATKQLPYKLPDESHRPGRRPAFADTPESLRPWVCPFPCGLRCKRMRPSTACAISFVRRSSTIS